MDLKLKPSHFFTFCLEKLLDLYSNHTNDSGLRDRSVVENTHNSCRRPVFDSQHPHDFVQLSVNPAPGDLTPSLTTLGTGYTHNAKTCRLNTHEYKISKYSFLMI